jgi:TM2 domain-containing membrane protein YozV
VGGYQPMQAVNQNAMTDWKAMGADKKITAGICAILVGWLGVHKFILGYTTEGVIQLVLGILTCGLTNIISIVEGVIYLTKSDEEFVRTYIQNKKGWF